MSRVQNIIESLKGLSAQHLKSIITAAKSAVKATVKAVPVTDVNLVAGITAFFQPSSRAENDAANKLREKILEKMCHPPKEYLDHPEFGASWRIVHEQWTNALVRVAANASIPTYTSTSIEMKGGRGFHYDAIVTYYNEGVPVANQNIEFKYGGTNIGALPQFLSLQAKMKLFDKTYDEFWYERYLDQYLACDLGLTEAKPSLETYLKRVTSTVYSITPFFAKLKERELLFQDEKNEVVDRSITDYLTTYGNTIHLPSFEEKVQATQRDKIYMLWSNGAFHIDSMSETEISNLTFHGIRNGNVLELRAGSASYRLLLRWRNHKGILNPAWQISMKRTIE
jgi:hypothetical protein